MVTVSYTNTTTEWQSIFPLKLAAWSWADGHAKGREAALRRRHSQVFLWGGRHLREHREWAMFLYVTGQSSMPAGVLHSFCLTYHLFDVIKINLCDVSRNVRTLLNIGWTIWGPNRAKPFIIFTSWRVNQSVDISIYLFTFCPKKLQECIFFKSDWSCVCVSFLVPELLARRVILQMFPIHEQRILNQLMTSWVQAVCEKQPLGEKIAGGFHCNPIRLRHFL